MSILTRLGLLVGLTALVVLFIYGSSQPDQQQQCEDLRYQSAQNVDC